MTRRALLDVDLDALPADLSPLVGDRSWVAAVTSVLLRYQVHVAPDVAVERARVDSLNDQIIELQRERQALRGKLDEIQKLQRAVEDTRKERPSFYDREASHAGTAGGR